MKVFAKVFLLPLFLLVSWSTQVFAIYPADILKIFEIASSSKQEEKESSQWKKTETSKSYRQTTIFTSESYPNFYFQLQIPTGDGPVDRPFHFALFNGTPSPSSQAVWSISECVDAQTLSALFKLSFEELLKFLEDKIAGMGSSPAKNLLKAFVSMIKAYMVYQEQREEEAQRAQANAPFNELFDGDYLSFGDDDDIFAYTPNTGAQQNATDEQLPSLDGLNLASDDLDALRNLIAPSFASSASSVVSGTFGSASK